jgi:hypothetical protein
MKLKKKKKKVQKRQVKQFEIRASGDKQLFDRKNLARSSSISPSM